MIIACHGTIKKLTSACFTQRFLKLTNAMTIFSAKKWRDEFPFCLKENYYLNHAAISPLPARTIKAVEKSLSNRTDAPVESFEKDDEAIEQTRSLAARLINAPSPDDITFISNTTHGLNIIANGFPFEKGDEILLHPMEFPTNVYPWLNLKDQGVNVRFMADENGTVSIENLLKHLSPKTKMVALSMVQFISGYLADIKEICRICHGRGIYVVVDGIQAAGCVPIDVQESGVDALCAGGHKWLMSPQGTGFLYMTPEFRDMLTLAQAGWLSVEEPWDFFNRNQKIKTCGRKFENGMPNVPGLYGLGASLSLILEAGPAGMFKHISSLGDILAEGLTRHGFTLYTDISNECRSGITTFRLPDRINPDAFLNRLFSVNVFISVRDGYIRFSPHFYNTVSDIEFVIKKCCIK